MSMELPATPIRNAEGAEDAALEASILRAKLTSERTKVRNYQESMHHLKTKLSQKDTKISQLSANVDSQFKLLMNYEHQRKEMETKIATLTKSVRLLKEGCQVTIDPSVLAGNTTASGKARFELQKRREVKYLQLKSKYKTSKLEWEEKMQALEQTAMEFEDEYSPDTIKSVLDNIKRLKVDEKLQGEKQVKRKTLVSYTTDNHEKYQLNFRENIPLKATDDEYTAALMKKSAFGETLGLIKQDLGTLIKEMKRSSDEGLSCLWMIFTEKQNLYRPRDDFFKQTKQVLQQSSLFLKDFARKTNQLTKKFTDREKTVKQQWKLESVERDDVWCEADLPTPAYLEAEAEIKILKARITQLTAKFTEKESELEVNLEKTQTNLRFLQQRTLELHKAAFHAMRTVYKHRYKWTTKFQDPLREINRQINEQRRKPQPLDVTFNLSLGEIVDSDVELLKKFADYFIGDSFFGADMNHLKDKELEEQQKKKEGKADKSGISDGSPMNTKPGYGYASGSDADDPTESSASGGYIRQAINRGNGAKNRTRSSSPINTTTHSLVSINAKPGATTTTAQTSTTQTQQQQQQQPQPQQQQPATTLSKKTLYKKTSKASLLSQPTTSSGRQRSVSMNAPTAVNTMMPPSVAMRAKTPPPLALVPSVAPVTTSTNGSHHTSVLTRDFDMITAISGEEPKILESIQSARDFPTKGHPGGELMMRSIRSAPLRSKTKVGVASSLGDVDFHMFPSWTQQEPWNKKKPLQTEDKKRTQLIEQVVGTAKELQLQAASHNVSRKAPQQPHQPHQPHQPILPSEPSTRPEPRVVRRMSLPLPQPKDSNSALHITGISSPIALHTIDTPKADDGDDDPFSQSQSNLDLMNSMLSLRRSVEKDGQREGELITPQASKHRRRKSSLSNHKSPLT